MITITNRAEVKRSRRRRLQKNEIKRERRRRIRYRRARDGQLGDINVPDVGSRQEVWLSGVLGSDGYEKRIRRKEEEGRGKKRKEQERKEVKK